MNNTEPYYDNDRNPEERERTVFEKAWDIEDIEDRIFFLQEESGTLKQQLNVRIFTRLESDEYTAKMENALDEISKVGIDLIDIRIEQLKKIKRKQDGQTKIDESTIHAGKGIQTKFTPPQLGLIFDALLIPHLKQSDKSNFIAVFRNGPLPNGWKKVTWSKSRKKFHSFFEQMTGQSEPVLMNKYFIHESKTPFKSNDKPKSINIDVSKILKKVNP